MTDSVSPRPIAVIGAGFIGAPLVRRLVADGQTLRVFTRGGDWREGEAPAKPIVELRALDLVQASVDDLRRALGDVSALVLAYATGGTQDRRALYVEGARKLVAALGDAEGLARVIYCSSTSALPDGDGPLDEGTAAWPEHERGRVQREAEQIIREGFGRRAIVLRLAGLYGPGRELGKLYLRRPVATQRGHGWKATNLIHRDDAVEALRLAIELDARHLADDGLVVHVCDDDHRPRREMLDRLAARSGLEAPRWEAPAPSGPPQGKRVSNDRMKSMLGLTLRHPDHDPDHDHDPARDC